MSKQVRKLQIEQGETAIKTEEDALEIGTTMPDGSVFAGLTADGKHQIYAMPTDLKITMTFNKAARVVEKLNSEKFLGHDDWQIPSGDNLCVLYENRNEGTLKGTFFHKKGRFFRSAYPEWYWSSTENRDDPPFVWVVGFSDGTGGWCRRGVYGRLSCRPVRLVAASAPAAPSR